MQINICFIDINLHYIIIQVILLRIDFSDESIQFFLRSSYIIH